MTCAAKAHSFLLLCGILLHEFTHHELIERQGIYRRIYDIQMSQDDRQQMTAEAEECLGKEPGAEAEECLTRKPEADAEECREPAAEIHSDSRSVPGDSRNPAWQEGGAEDGGI